MSKFRGYKTPEYAVMGAISKKSDVFSFGVIALEIVTGKRNSSLLENFDDLISHVSIKHMIKLQHTQSQGPEN